MAPENMEVLGQIKLLFLKKRDTKRGLGNDGRGKMFATEV